jgi:hypothetical protein
MTMSAGKFEWEVERGWGLSSMGSSGFSRTLVCMRLEIELLIDIYFFEIRLRVSYWQKKYSTT